MFRSGSRIVNEWLSRMRKGTLSSESSSPEVTDCWRRLTEHSNSRQRSNATMQTVANFRSRLSGMPRISLTLLAPFDEAEHELRGARLGPNSLGCQDLVLTRELQFSRPRTRILFSRVL